MTSQVFSNDLSDMEINLSVNGRLKAILSPGDTIALDIPSGATVGFSQAGYSLPAVAPGLAVRMHGQPKSTTASQALVPLESDDTKTNGKGHKRPARPVNQYRGTEFIQTLPSVGSAAASAGFTGRRYYDFLNSLQSGGKDGFSHGEFTYYYADASPTGSKTLPVVERARRSGKRVIQMDRDGTPLRIWDSQSIAADELGIDKSSISKVCNGKWDVAGGFRWKFATAA